MDIGTNWRYLPWLCHSEPIWRVRCNRSFNQVGRYRLGLGIVARGPTPVRQAHTIEQHANQTNFNERAKSKSLQRP